MRAPRCIGLRHLLFAGLICAILYGASLATRRVTPAIPGVPFTATGAFTPDGQYPGEAFAHADQVRKWGSWSGDDDNTGTFVLGPFPAPRILHFAASGYPNDPNNALHVERIGTGERRPVPCGPVGERWEIVTLVLPADWEDQPIQLVGSDQARGIGGWFAVSEPVRGGRGDGNHALLETLATWAVNGLLLGVIYLAALRGLMAHAWLAPQWVPLGAGAVVAASGYVAFWVYFVHALAGTIFAWTTIAGAALYALRRPATHPPANPAGATEAATVAILMGAIGAFHLGVLHLFPSPLDFYTLAANRFREALPSDNMLPHALGERLFASEPARNPTDAWRSSDRPPLQTGWQLLTWPAGKLLDLDHRSVSGTAAVWLQLLWVAGIYGVLRTFRLSPRQAAGWVAACALAGFFVQNTIFTWPKLSAGAFALGAFAVLVLPTGSMTTRARGGWAAFFAALGWLSHGGVAFSYLPLVPWVAWRAVQGDWRPWWPGAIVCVALMLPWLAYQKFYDPPGTMLLKLHLAGQDQEDGRSLGQTLRENYVQLGAAEAWANKASNFHAQIYGRWSFLLDVSAATRVERRNEEFFHAGRGLTWWPVLALLAIALTGRRALARLFHTHEENIQRNIRLPCGQSDLVAASPDRVGPTGRAFHTSECEMFGLASARDLGLLTAWLALTVVGWCLLLFGKYQAVIHHGSYALMLGWFVLFSVLLARSGRGWLPVIALLQAVTFATTWAVPNTVVHGPATGLFFVVPTGSILAWIIARAVTDGRGGHAPVDSTPDRPDKAPPP